MKTYCQCKSPEYIGAQLDYLPRAFNGNFVQVHPPCRLPFRLYWENFIRRCSDCLTEASLPWEEVCYNCFTGKKYMGWLRASKPISLEQRIAGRIKYGHLLKEFPETHWEDGPKPFFSFGVDPRHPVASLLASESVSETGPTFDFTRKLFILKIPERNS